MNHYDAITKVTGFLGAHYYCEYCNVGYSNRGDHRCADGCEDCYSDIPCIRGQKMRCMDCKRTIRSRKCFAKHKAMKSKQHKSICQLVYNCGKCGIRIVGKKKKIMYAHYRENVGIVKRLLDPIINAIFKVMNVNLS